MKYGKTYILEKPVWLHCDPMGTFSSLYIDKCGNQCLHNLIHNIVGRNSIHTYLQESQKIINTQSESFTLEYNYFANYLYLYRTFCIANQLYQ